MGSSIRGPRSFFLPVVLGCPLFVLPPSPIGSDLEPADLPLPFVLFIRRSPIFSIVPLFHTTCVSLSPCTLLPECVIGLGSFLVKVSIARPFYNHSSGFFFRTHSGRHQSVPKAIFLGRKSVFRHVFTRIHVGAYP